MFNPAMRFWLRQRWAPPLCYALVETTGRRSGQPRLTPVAGSLDGNTYWLVAEHGAAAYVKNLTAEPRVRVLLVRKWRSGMAACLSDDDAVARREWIDKRNGIAGQLDGIVFRAFASTPLTVRIDLDR